MNSYALTAKQEGWPKCGDVVRRKEVDVAVAAPMTVREIHNSTRAVVCNWFEGSEFKEDIFPMDTLEIVPNGERSQEFKSVMAEGKGKSFHRSFWGNWADKQILIHCKNNVIITGKFIDFTAGFLMLENATIRGKRTVHVERAQVDRDAVSHFHEPVEVPAQESRHAETKQGEAKRED